MNFDDLQKAWQSQTKSPQIMISSDILLKEVRRNQRQLWATIFWRDLREVGVAFLMAFYFLYHGWRNHDWTDFLSTAACIGIGTFMILDRVLQRKKSPLLNDSLKHCIEDSLAQVSHQIWLLKNIFWWYLLPLLLASAISMAHSFLNRRDFSHAAIVGELIAVLLVAAIFWGVYRWNQAAVRKSLEPRRLELEVLLANFQ